MTSIDSWLDDKYLNNILPNRWRAVQLFRELAELGFQYMVKYRWSFIYEGYVYSLSTGDFYSAPSRGKPDVKSGWDKFDGTIRCFSTGLQFDSVQELIDYHSTRPKIFLNEAS